MTIEEIRVVLLATRLLQAMPKLGKRQQQVLEANQRRLLDALDDHQFIIAPGPAYGLDQHHYSPTR